MKKTTIIFLAVTIVLLLISSATAVVTEPILDEPDDQMPDEPDDPENPEGIFFGTITCYTWHDYGHALPQSLGGVRLYLRSDDGSINRFRITGYLTGYATFRFLPYGHTYTITAKCRGYKDRVISGISPDSGSYVSFHMIGS
jgi:hypothetical protein